MDLKIIGWIIYEVCASITGISLWRDEIKIEVKIGMGFLVMVVMLSVLWPLMWICKLIELADRKIIVYSRKKEK